MFKRQKQVKVRVSVCVQEEIWSKNAEIFDNVNLNPDIFADGTFIPIVNKFVYLGSYLTRDCRDDMDVKERIYAAGGAFGNLRDCLFSFPKISPDAKIIVYIELILSILLYDSECWSLTEKLACCYHCGCQVDQEAALNLSMAGAWWKSSRGTILTPRYGTSLPRIEENGISLLVNYSFILFILLQRCESYIFYFSIYMGLFSMLGEGICLSVWKLFRWNYQPNRRKFSDLIWPQKVKILIFA